MIRVVDEMTENGIRWEIIARYTYKGITHVTWRTKVPDGWLIRQDAYLEEKIGNENVTRDFQMSVVKIQAEDDVWSIIPIKNKQV